MIGIKLNEPNTIHVIVALIFKSHSCAYQQRGSAASLISVKSAWFHHRNKQGRNASYFSGFVLKIRQS